MMIQANMSLEVVCPLLLTLLLVLLVKRKKKKRKSSTSKKKKKPKKKKRSSNKKKKGEPTRPRTAYTYFMKERRQEIADKNPIASFGEIAKMLGKYWKEEISPQEKEKVLKTCWRG